ncbi:hypothetical protein AA102526_2200 [Asaia lannensis NBRC 102526]|nr:hypothetical protein AA102526_2200 [Asaia lannensis NBRC 102526]
MARGAVFQCYDRLIGVLSFEACDEIRQGQVVVVMPCCEKVWIESAIELDTKDADASGQTDDDEQRRKNQTDIAVQGKKGFSSRAERPQNPVET